MAEVLKYGDDAVLPKCAVSRYEAISRVADGLSQIVDPECVAVEVASDQRKRLDGAVFPLRRQSDAIINDAGGAGVVQRAVFRESYDLPAVIDRAGLPVVSAERRESFYVEELPEERAADVMCAEAANVFAVGVCGGRFGFTDDLAEIINLAPVAGGVGSAECAEVELESVDIDEQAAA